MPSGSAQVVILGAGRSVRGALPSAMVDIDEHGRVLDWLLDAFAVLDDPDVAFVGGYRAEDVVERYPQLRAGVQPGVGRDRAGASRSPSSRSTRCGRRTSVTPTSCSGAVRWSALAAAPDGVAIAVDTQWRRRYDGRGPGDLEGAEKVRIVGRRGHGHRRRRADRARRRRVRGRAAPLAAGRARPRCGPSSPARSRPRPRCPRSSRRSAPPACRCTSSTSRATGPSSTPARTSPASCSARRRSRSSGCSRWTTARSSARWSPAPARLGARPATRCWTASAPSSPAERLIVRSSALSEDGWPASGAGPARERRRRRAGPRRARRGDRPGVRVVPRPEPARPGARAGDGARRRDERRRHDADARARRALLRRELRRHDRPHRHRDRAAATPAPSCASAAPSCAPSCPAAIAPVLSAVQNIEKLVGHDSLDIEFAVTARRRGAHPPGASDRAQRAVDPDRRRRDRPARCTTRQRRCASARAPAPTLVGATTRYSVMTDWNPAEIVGTTPRALALSLYRYLVTDDVWARQRAEYGYRDLRPCPLLVEIAGHPTSTCARRFNSFVPAALDDDLARRLVEHQLARLAADPALHDKVEFDVLDDLPRSRLRRARGRAARRRVRRRRGRRAARRAADITGAAFARLADRPRRPRRASTPRSRPTRPPPRRSTRPRTTSSWCGGGARSRSRTWRGPPSSPRAWCAGSSTAGALDGRAGRRVPRLRSRRCSAGCRPTRRGARRARSTWADFVGALRPPASGHLRHHLAELRGRARRVPAAARGPRPTAPRRRRRSRGRRRTRRDRRARSRRSASTSTSTASTGSSRAAIAGREEGKFVFTRACRDALEELAEFGARHGFDRDDLSHVRIADLFCARDAVADPAGSSRGASRGRRGAPRHPGGCAARPRSSSVADLVCFEQAAAEPNFVTRHAVQAPTVVGRRPAPAPTSRAASC